MNTIPANIAALAKCCDTESTRYALGGVSVEIKNGKYECAATDTRRLVVVSGECVQKPTERLIEQTTTIHQNKRIDAKPVSVVIGAKELRRCAGLSQDRKPVFGFAQTADAVRIGLDGKRTVEVPPVEGRFPKYRDVIPKKPPTHTLHFNAKLLSEMLMLATAFREPGRTIDEVSILLEVHDAESPIVIRISPQSMGTQDFTGVIMPLSQDR